MVKYEVYVFGGSLGEIKYDESKRKFFSGLGNGRLWGTYPSKKEAQAGGRSYIKSFSGGYRNYYRPKYRIIKV